MQGHGKSVFDLSGAMRSGDVAIVRSIREAAPPMAMRHTHFWVDSAERGL